MTITKLEQRKINHVAFVLDESGSMGGLKNDVITVFDNQVKWLLDLSKKTGQETRVSIYTLSGTDVRCPLFDTDVHHLPSLLGNYNPANGTPLIDATLKAIDDLGQTAQMYGDHAFLIFVLTDGDENTSQFTPPGYHIPAGNIWAHNASHNRNLKAAQSTYLGEKIKNLPDNWTLGCLVPSFNHKLTAQAYGFDSGNIAIWDTNAAGLDSASDEVREATQSFYEGRASGTRGTKTLFSGINKQAVQAAGLKPIPTDEYLLLNVIPTKGIEIKIPAKSILKSRPEGLKHVEIQAFIEANGHTYVTGRAYYELLKSEKISGNKDVIVVENATGLAYSGDQARKLVGLDMWSTRAKPMAKDKVTGKREFDIFIRSDSVNRLLEIHNSRVLLRTK